MKRWKKWELALLLGLCAALVWGAWAAQRQDALARKMIRLHVIANSEHGGRPAAASGRVRTH